MIERKFKIKNKLGIHARPAAQLVKVAAGFKSAIYISKDGHEVNGKSIMGVLTLEAGFGSEITIRIDGEDELDAVDQMEELIDKRNFNENQINIS
jgi:phosphocarrier protein HPr